MTAPEDAVRRAQLERQQAAQDVADIEALSKYDPFKRYWESRLGAMFVTKVRLARTAPTAELREQARHEANLLEELTQMPAKDRQAAQRMVDSIPPDGRRHPTQAS